MAHIDRLNEARNRLQATYNQLVEDRYFLAQLTTVDSSSDPRVESRGASLVFDWECDFHKSTAGCMILGIDFPTMGFKDPATDRETETGTVKLCCEEGIEGMSQCLIIEAAPVISGRDSDRFRLVQTSGMKGYFDPCVRISSLNCVLEHMPKD